MGRSVDDETGKSHLAHAICDLLFLLAYELREAGTDDRSQEALPYYLSDQTNLEKVVLDPAKQVDDKGMVMVGKPDHLQRVYPDVRLPGERQPAKRRIPRAYHRFDRGRATGYNSGEHDL